MTQLPIEPPESTEPLTLVVWGVSIVIFLLGGGFLWKAYKARLDSFRAREEKSWELIKEQVEEQKLTIAEQEVRIDRLKARAEEYYKNVDELHQKNFEDRAARHTQVIELQRGLYEEKETSKQTRDMFTLMTAKFEACREAEARKDILLEGLSRKVAECEQRDQEKTTALYQVGLELQDMRRQMVNANIWTGSQ